MRLTDLTDTAADTVRSASAYVQDLTTPTLRLGVTGLSRAGKTVFITTLVHALTERRANPSIPLTDTPGFRAYLEPQPDDTVPRFAYEDHVAALTGSTPQWPKSTRQISQLRVTLEWEPADWARQIAGIGRRLHIDIVDYPGEWLIDLGLLDMSFGDWSSQAAHVLEAMPATPPVEAWRTFLATLDSQTPSPEQIAIEGAGLYTRYLLSVRQHNQQALTAAPGRFLMPGDLDGTPLLTFFPIDAMAAGTPLHAMLSRRFESYKLKVVKPFFEDHFARLDRQIVLIDVLSALNGGATALRDLDNALDQVLRAFNPGANSWLSFLLGRRTDRIVFAATKADHLNRRNHERLRAILSAIVRRAEGRAQGAGAAITEIALAGLRATEDVTHNTDGGALPCIRGIPVTGETIAGRTFDGQTPAVVFPGDLPEDPLDVFDESAFQPGQLRFPKFRPPQAAPSEADAQMVWPHIGLDDAIRFLIGDRIS